VALPFAHPVLDPDRLAAPVHLGAHRDVAVLLRASASDRDGLLLVVLEAVAVGERQVALELDQELVALRLR
jgi:hypothetical protein